ELVRLKVDVIVASGGGGNPAGKKKSRTKPPVMGQTEDPRARGIVARPGHPRGDNTRRSPLSPQVKGERRGSFKEDSTKHCCVAVFGTSSSPGNAPVLSETKLAAGSLGLNIQYVDVLSSKDFDSAFRTAAKGRAEAVLWLVSGSVDSGHKAKIAELAIKSRLPTI